MSVVSLSTTQQDDALYQMFSAGSAFQPADAKQATMRPVMFTVTTNGLWDIYLRSIPAAMRQYYTCTDCRHFIQRFRRYRYDPPGRNRQVCSLAEQPSVFLSVNCLKGKSSRVQ